MSSLHPITQQLAQFRSQTMGSLFSGGAAGASFANVFASASDAHAGNPALRDPASAWRMMSRINGYEATFKAQHATLAQMGREVDAMGEAGAELGAAVNPDTAIDAVVARIKGFIARYNAWEEQFDQDLERGGLLENVQAAQITRTRLEQTMRNIFNGSVEGVNGLPALGISIDPVSRQATLDEARLKSVLGQQKQAAVAAIDAFAAELSGAADLLTSSDNVIQHQLDNRQRAIDFIARNRADLSAEFGAGDAAQPNAQTARALAAYEAMRAA